MQNRVAPCRPSGGVRDDDVINSGGGDGDRDDDTMTRYPSSGSGGGAETTRPPSSPRVQPTTPPKGAPTPPHGPPSFAPVTTASLPPPATRASPPPSVPPPVVKQLVCTVGHSAVVAAMYPPDKFCDFLYYCEVVIKSNFLRAAKVQASWRAFQDMAPSYQRAQPGVSFDFRFIAKDKLLNAARNVSGLAQKNIKHFGVLNIITVQTRLRQYVTEMKDVFE
ncbi:hypothetical protein V5799_028897, partial [Amblyomma americanum]